MARERQTNLGSLVRKTDRWREMYNPLRGLTIARAVCLLEQYRRGEMTELQWLYSHIEETDETLMALIERRVGALMELDWEIRTIDTDDLPDGVTEEMVEEQRAFLHETYDRIDNLKEAIDFLGMATFRGFAHVQKQDRDGDGMIDHLECIDQWNWVRKGMFGDWFYNKDARPVTAEALENKPEAQIEVEEFIIRTVTRHLDRVALIKFIRTSLGEKDWTAFIEIYGIPGGVVTMPPNVPDAQRDSYLDMAKDVAAGGNGVIPNGGEWKPNDGPRGVNPFRDFLRYLDEKLVLAGTGGLLTMLTESGSGTLAGNAHQNTFETIARADGAKVSEVFQKQFDKALLAEKFPEQPVLAFFELDRSELSDEEIQFKREVWKTFATDGTVGDMLANQTDLKELTREVALPVNEEYTDQYLPVRDDKGVPITGKVALDAEGDPIGAEPGQAEPEPTAPGGAGNGQSAMGQLKNRGPGEDVPSFTMEEVAQAFAEDLRPIRKRLEAIVRIQDPEVLANRLRAFQAELPQLVADMNADPEAAKVLARIMAGEMAKGLTERLPRS